MKPKKNDKERIKELEDCLRQIQKISRDEFLNDPNIIAEIIDKVLKPYKK